VILLQSAIETAQKIENVRSSIIQSGKPEDPNAIIEDYFL